MQRLLLALLFAGIFLPPVPAAESSRFGTVELRLKHGDDPRWARPDWDDRDWTVISPTGFPVESGIYWVRIRLVRPDRPTPRPPGLEFYNYAWPSDEPGAPIDSVIFSPIFSFDFYWDGRLLESSGRPGNDRASEVPGPLDHLIRIPDDLRAPGEHVVALRLSSHHYNQRWHRPSLPFRLDNYASRLTYEVRRPFLPLVGAGIAFLTAVGCLGLMRIFGRRRVLLLCGLLGLTLAAFHGLVALRWVYNATYDWHAPRLTLITVLMAITGLLLPWVLAEHFELPRARRWLWLLIPCLIAGCFVSPMYQVKAYWLTRTMLGAALGIAVWAAWRRKPGAWPVGLAAILGLMIDTEDGRAVLDSTFFVIVGGMMIFVLVALVRQIQAEQRRAGEALLATARLETELLKKNLQPHFLLNTLTAISEVIEQDPAGAVRFIDDLADEFRSLSHMSGEKLVPLAQELELCRAHLRVIARRTGRAVAIEASVADERVAVPPALFLTLVENGLVYQRPAGGTAFRLRQERAAAGLRYTFISPGETRERVRRVAGGTGLRYVKARLEESFPGAWSFRQQAVAEGWETVIELNGGQA